MGIDTGAGASVSYAVTARANATGLRGEAKILAISGVTGYQARNASEVSLGSSQMEILNLQTALAAGDNIVLAITETVNKANGSDFLQYVKLNSGPDGGWTGLAQSEGLLWHGLQRDTGKYENLEDMQIQLIPYLHSGASANPRYSVTSVESGGGAKMYGVAKIVAFRKPTGWDAAFVDCPQQTMSSSEQTLCTLNPGWGSEKAGREVAVIASEQFKSASPIGSRILASGSNKLSYEDQPSLGEMTNEYELNLRDWQTGDDGKGFGFLGRWANMPGYATQYWKTKVTGGSPDYYGESKILAIVPPASTPLPFVSTDTINLRVYHTRTMKHGVFHNSFGTSNSYGFAIKTSSRKANLTQGYSGVAG